MVEFGCCNHFRPSGDKKEIGSLVGTLKIEAPLKIVPISADCLEKIHTVVFWPPKKSKPLRKKKEKKTPCSHSFEAL